MNIISSKRILWLATCAIVSLGTMPVLAAGTEEERRNQPPPIMQPGMVIDATKDQPAVQGVNEGVPPTDDDMSSGMSPSMPTTDGNLPMPTDDVTGNGPDDKSKEELQKQIDAMNIDPELVKGMAPEEILLMSVQKDMKKELNNLNNIPFGIPTLFFSPHEHLMLQKALVGFQRNFKNPNPESEKIALPMNGDDLQNSFAKVRDLTLGGIMYDAKGKWTVWMNNQRLTPKRLPTEVRDIKVYRDYIELKWYDTQTKQLLPVRLRPNQKFNLDTQTFMPG